MPLFYFVFIWFGLAKAGEILKGSVIIFFAISERWQQKAHEKQKWNVKVKCSKKPRI